jgi:hypothetical protein
MAIIQVGRPFVFNTGQRPRWVFGVGVYGIPDAISGQWYIQHHTQQAVLARGGALIQHRVPQGGGNPGSAFSADGMMWVDDILPQPILIWGWPPGAGGAQFIDGLIEPAPGAVTFAMVPIEGEPGHFDRVLQPAPRYIPTGRFDPALPAPGINPPLVRFPMAPRHGDIYACGFPPDMPPIDARQADIPAMREQQALLMRVQREGACARMGKWRPV